MTSPGSDRVDECARRSGTARWTSTGHESITSRRATACTWSCSTASATSPGIGVGADLLWNSLEVLRAVVDRSGQRDVLRDRLPELAMPTLIVWGERDRVVPLAQARDAVGRLRRARLVVIPDCGHLPQIERPELFLKALGSFLDGPSAGPNRPEATPGNFGHRRSHGTGPTLTPADEEFDIVLAAAVLHHLLADQEWRDVFAAFYRACGPAACCGSSTWWRVRSLRSGD